MQKIVHVINARNGGNFGNGESMKIFIIKKLNYLNTQMIVGELSFKRLGISDSTNTE